MEPSPEGKEDLEKRTSLPVMPVVSMPDSSTSRIPKELGGETATISQAPKEEEVSTADSVETNGPCPEPIPAGLELTQSQVDTAEDRGPDVGDGVDSSGETIQGPGIVKVEWDGLRFLEESAREAPTCTEKRKVKEQEVEEVVLEVIGDHQVTGDPELPEWMMKDRRVQEVEETVLEAMKSRSKMEAPELPEWVTQDRGIVEVVWEGLGGTDGSDMGDSEEMARQEEVIGSPASSGLKSKEQGPGGSPELGDQGEGSFIWVERVLITEDWEEVLVEESEGTAKESKESEAGEDLPLGGEEEREKEQLGAEEEEEEKHLETEKLGSEGETEEVFQRDGGREVHIGAEEIKGDKGHLGEEKEGEGKEQEEAEEEAGEEKQLEAEEKAGEEKQLGGEEKEEREELGSKEEEEKEREGGIAEEMPADKDPTGEKGPEDEKEEQEEEMKPASQGEKGPEPQAEEAESVPPEPQAPAPPLEQLSAPEVGPPEQQPLLQPAVRTVNPASRPVPTYTPTPRAEQVSDSEQASGSKQTCQCCVVM